MHQCESLVEEFFVNESPDFLSPDVITTATYKTEMTLYK